VTEEPTATGAPTAAQTETNNQDSQPGEQAAAEKSVWDDARLPWSGKPGKADIACWAAIVLSGVYYWAIFPWRVSLVGTHPVISELLNGSTESIVSAGSFARVGHGSLAVAVLAAVPGLCKFDIIYWWAGRLWGEKFILLLSGKHKHGPKYMARVQRWGRWFTWPAVVVCPFLPIPNAIVYVIAGWAEMRLVTFLILDVIGTLLWVGMLVGLGYALGHRGVVVAHEISKYGLWVTGGILVLVVFSQVRSSRRNR